MTTEPARQQSALRPDVNAIVEAGRKAVGRTLLKHKLLRQSVVAVDDDNEPYLVQPDDIDTGLAPEEEQEEIRTAGHGTWFSSY